MLAPELQRGPRLAQRVAAQVVRPLRPEQDELVELEEDGAARVLEQIELLVGHIASREAETEHRYGAVVTIRDIEARAGVQFAYALNLSICIGCRRCGR